MSPSSFRSPRQPGDPISKKSKLATEWLVIRKRVNLPPLQWLLKYQSVLDCQDQMGHRSSLRSSVVVRRRLSGAET